MRRITSVLAMAVILVAATMAAAAATHEDVIPEPIEQRDIDVGVETLVDGFTTPLWAINAPGDNKRIFVVDQVGKIWAIATDPGKHRNVPDRHLVLDVGADGLDLLVPLGAFGPGSFDERGLLGLAFDPDTARTDSSTPIHRNRRSALPTSRRCPLVSMPTITR